MATAALSPIYGTKFRPPSQTRQRCISSNFIVVHQDGGKSPIMTKQSSFNITGDGRVMESPRPDLNCEKEEDANEPEEVEPAAAPVEKKVKEYVAPIVKLRVIGYRNSCEALRESVRILRWKMTTKPVDGPFDIYWHPLTYDAHAHIDTLEHSVFAVSKLPGMLDISHKVYMSRILKRMQYLFPTEFEFYSPTWILPEQYHQFLAESSLSRTKVKAGIEQAATKEGKAYIVKPDAGRQGEGIYLVNDPRDVIVDSGMKPVIVQEYIRNPMLLDGFKFDLRIYAVVARLEPLEVYICKEGLVRLCTTPYESPTKKNIQNTYMHLTNYSLNRYSEDYIHTDAGNSGSKRLFSIMEKELSDAGYDIEKQRKHIRSVVLKTVLSFLPDLTIWNHVTRKPSGARPFQVLGFDIMLSDDMKAHLIEVNAAPSLRIDAEQETEPGSGIMENVTSVVDREVKVRLIKDTLNLIAYGDRGSQESCLERIYPKSKKEKENEDQEFKQQSKVKDPVRNSDWNFFDAREAGLSLLATERHPMILEKSISRQSIYSQCNDNPTDKISPRQSTKDKYMKCKHCHRYLTSEIGPGILEERRIEKDDEVRECESRISVVQNKLPVLTQRSVSESTETTFWDVLNDVQKMANNTRSETVRDTENKRHANIDYLLQRRVRYNRKIHRGVNLTENNFVNKHAWILNRAAHIFIYFNGFTPKLTMSSTSFRNMARKCELCDHGALPSIDILFVEIVRQWNNHVLSHGTPFYNTSSQYTAKLSQGSGLPFQGFVDALLRIAGDRYRGENIAEKLEHLLENCENYIKFNKKGKSKNSNNVDITMTLSQKQPRRKTRQYKRWTNE